MRRAGFTGDIWPDEIQELLLRAALLPGDAGVAAWAAVRPRIDVDHLPGELHRLMPLLSKALTAGGVDDPVCPPCCSGGPRWRSHIMATPECGR